MIVRLSIVLVELLRALRRCFNERVKLSDCSLDEVRRNPMNVPNFGLYIVLIYELALELWIGFRYLYSPNILQPDYGSL